MKRYFHISPRRNYDSISKHGLEANAQGQIFLFEDKTLIAGDVSMRVSDSIAYKQVGLKGYDVWEVLASSFQTALVPDAVGEITHQYQHILQQQNISPAYCKYRGNRTVKVAEVEAYPLVLLRRQGHSLHIHYSGAIRITGTLPPALQDVALMQFPNRKP